MKKSLIAALVFASASLAGSAAFAQTTGGSTNTGSTTGGSTSTSTKVVGNTPQTLTLTDGAGFFGDTFGANNMGSTFSDKFNFSIAAGTTGSPTMSSMDAIISSISRTADTGLAITGLSLYNAAGTVVAQGKSLQSGTVDVWTISGDNLMAGNYYLQVSGNLVGNTAAAFGGAVSMAAPVPEPETYGMMLAGLGVLGFLARRRKAAKQA